MSKTGNKLVELAARLGEVAVTEIDRLEKELARTLAQKDAQNAELGRALLAQDQIRANQVKYRDPWVLAELLDEACTERKDLVYERDSLSERLNHAHQEVDDMRATCQQTAEERDREIDACIMANKERVSLADERDELLRMLDDAGPRVDKANDATNQARVERDEAKAEAQTAMETVERLTRELAAMKDCYRGLVDDYWDKRRELFDALIEHHRDCHHKEETYQPLSKHILKLAPLSIEEKTGEGNE